MNNPLIFKPRAPGRIGRRQSQSGVVLILALILLVVISGVAVLSVRGAMSGEQVSNNIRVNTVATQASETALRYCENAVLAGGAPVQLLPLGSTPGVPPSRWATRSNWTTATVIIVPTAVLDSADSAGRTTAKAPMCMVEEMRLTNISVTQAANYLVTSRGFSQDYTTAANGSVLSGSEVWMQSYLRY